MIVEPCRGVTARSRATRQALNGWYPGPIHMSRSEAQEVTNGRFMRRPLTPHCCQCTMWARMCTSVAPTKELLDLFDAEKEPGTRIYHVTMRENCTSWLIFFGWFPGKGLKTKQNSALAREGSFLSVKRSRHDDKHVSSSKIKPDYTHSQHAYSPPSLSGPFIYL